MTSVALRAGSTGVAEIAVEFCYALPERQELLRLQLPAGATVADALAQARLHIADLPETAELGIHGRLCAPDTVLRAGDRVEIYRPLHFDPMESRRRRAAKHAAAPRRAR